MDKFANSRNQAIITLKEKTSVNQNSTSGFIKKMPLGSHSHYQFEMESQRRYFSWLTYSVFFHS